MSFGIVISSGSPKSLATRDVERYGRLLISKGGTDIFSNGEAQKLRAFAEAFYAQVGRADFLDLRSVANMGSGSMAYTFHGAPTTLVNGPTWAADGLQVSGSWIWVGWPVVTGDNPRSFCSVWSFDLIDQVWGLFQFSAEGSPNQAFSSFSVSGYLYVDYWNNGGNALQIAHTNKRFYGVSYNSPISSMWDDGSPRNDFNAGPTNTLTGGASFGLAGGKSMNGKLSFLSYRAASMSDADYAAIRSLYTTTIGIGIL